MDRIKILEKTKGYCYYCGNELFMNFMDIDHFIPKRKGGTDNIENLVPSCKSCNRSKSSFDIEQWRNELEKSIERLNKSTTSYRIAKRFGLIEETGKKVKFFFEN